MCIRDRAGSALAVRASAAAEHCQCLLYAAMASILCASVVKSRHSSDGAELATSVEMLGSVAGKLSLSGGFSARLEKAWGSG